MFAQNLFDATSLNDDPVTARMQHYGAITKVFEATYQRPRELVKWGS